MINQMMMRAAGGAQADAQYVGGPKSPGLPILLLLLLASLGSPAPVTKGGKR